MTLTMDQMNETQRLDVISDLNDLLKLDHDAIDAYEETINRLDNQEWAHAVEVFKGDHERHVRDLTELVNRLGGEPAEKPHATGPMKKALVSLGAAAGDKGVLASFRGNELQVRNKYDAYTEKTDKYPGEVLDVIRRNAQDEHRHYAWVVNVIGSG